MELSIVIVNYNSKGYLNKCLASIYWETKDLDFEVLVVDNASTDNSLALMEQAFPRIKVIRNKHNLGFSAANNLGIKASTGKYILLLNHDTEIKGNAIKKLVDFMDEDRSVGACGPKVLNSDGSLQHQCKRGFPTPTSILFYISGLSKLFPKNGTISHYLMTHLDPDKIGEVDALSGACMLLRRTTIDKVGLLDDQYFLYGEDIDLCYRIKQAGFKIYYVPRAEIIHYGGVGSRIMSHKNIIEFHRSMLIFYKKHYRKKYGLVVTWLVYTGICLKCSINLILNTFRQEKYVGSKKP